MLDNFREFELKDPFERLWKVELRWHQNAISIRHADAIDVKYYLSGGGEKRELVVALAHPDLVKLAAAHKRAVTDAWVIRLAALHVVHMVTTWTDMEQTLVTAAYEELDAYQASLEQEDARRRERALLSH